MNKKQAFLILFFIVNTIAVFALQPDTLLVKNTKQYPTIDGKAEEAMWQNTEWQSIDQVWIPLNQTIDATDFSGRYKMLWSAETNLLYFIAEITDDVFRYGYKYSKKDITYADYDIFEVFIDPDHSGGLHVFDGKCDDAQNKKCWGTNAENAFTYHINANAPVDGQTTILKTVEDISGKGWHRKFIRNYADHLPEFAFRKTGDVYSYEFSLKVYKDSYNPELPSEIDRDSLYAGKIMALSVAYCDSDLKQGKPQRDNFIGSTLADLKVLDVHGNFNQVWMNASYLGVIQLIEK